MEALRGSSAYAAFAGQILKSKWVRPNKRIFDDSKISDHFAIIPTLQRRRTFPSLRPSFTTWWSSDSSRCSIRPPNIC
jgi:hypothetical protein